MAEKSTIPVPASIVLGIGSGRCGTLSLARLLEKQTNAHVTHELRPLLPWDCDERETIVSARVVRLVEFAGWLVGDVGSFYLPYLEQFIAIVPDIRIVCLKRDREAVVESFSRWSEG